MYLRDNASGTYLPLVTEADTAPATVFGGQVHFVSATADLSHVVLTSNVALLGAGSAPGLYEWSAGQLKFVSVLPGGAPAPGLIALGYYHLAANALSSDGSRVIWTIKEENASRGHLYLRDIARGQTVRLDAAQGTAEPGGVGVAQFQSASSDGSRIFFTDKQKLTADSTAEAKFPEKPDLYECEIDRSSRRTGLPAQRPDGRPARRRARQRAGLHLRHGRRWEQCLPRRPGRARGQRKRQRRNRGLGPEQPLSPASSTAANGTTTFIATLSGEDNPEWEGSKLANSAYLTARVSPSGRYLAFMSLGEPHRL